MRGALVGRPFDGRHQWKPWPISRHREDGLCLADCIADANGNFQAAFPRYESARVVRTASVTFESRYIWDVYHSDGIRREVNWQMLGERSEADTFQCLAWLYDGFALPPEPPEATH